MRILVTGANGLIGKKLIKQLLASGGYEIYATSLKRMQIQGVQTFTSNLLNADINQLVEQLQLDTIVHCAALSSPDACEVDRFVCKRMNVEVTSRIVSACRDYSVNLVFLSTDFVFDGSKGNYSENDATNPVSYYGESKVEAEKLVTTLGDKHSIVRTSLVYGYEERLSRPNILTRIVDNLKQGKTYRVPTDQIRTPTLAEDVAIGIENVISKKTSGIYHISGDESIPVSDFAMQIGNAFGLNASLLKNVTTVELSEPSPRPLNSSLNIRKAKNELNYNPRKISDALNLIKSQMQQ